MIELLFSLTMFGLICAAYVVAVWALRRPDREKRREQATCDACQSKMPVVFINDQHLLCAEHQAQWQRIDSLEHETLDS